MRLNTCVFERGEAAVRPQFRPVNVPASSLIISRECQRNGTVVQKDGHDVAHLAPITIGQDDGATVQVTSGLNANDRVIQDPPDSMIEGEKLFVEQPSGQNDGESATNPKLNGGK